MELAARNRKIKTILSQAFGAGKIKVRGHRGSSYGWVSVNIDYTPKSTQERDDLTKQIWKLFGLANIEIGSYDSADYGSGREIHIKFNPVWDWENDFNYVGSRHHY